MEVAWEGDNPRTIEEVYIHDGVPYLALDDILATLGMQGHWSSVDHLYSFNTPLGKASLFPGGHYLRVSERFIPLEHPPRFLDSRLRVAEDFLLVQLPLLTGRSIYFRNLNPTQSTAKEESPLDRLFSFLLQKKQPGPKLRGVAIDVAHGGQDPGAIGPRGTKEKDVVLQVARQLEKLIKMQLGVPVYLSRDDDYSLTTQQRLETAAHPEVDAYVLLHAQVSTAPKAEGVVLFIRPQESAEKGSGQADDADSLRLALASRNSLAEHQIPVDKIREAPLLPMGRGNLPTVLVELGYLNNATDRQRLTTSEGQKQLAEALLAGIRQFAEEQRRPKK